MSAMKETAMPEGHSIRRLATAFQEGFLDQRLQVSSPQGRFASGASEINNHVLVASRAKGKHLFLGFAPSLDTDAGQWRWLHIHLGLYGAWTFAGDEEFHGPHAIGAPRVRIAETETAVRADAADLVWQAQQAQHEAESGEWEPLPPRGAVRVRLLSEHGVADLTGPTRCEVIDTTELAAVEKRLGPDPLLPDPDGSQRAAFIAAVRASRVTAGALLMDQSVLAGVGNIYRAELLYRAKVYPLRPGASLSARKVGAIWDDAVALMADGVADGKIITTRVEDRKEPDDQWYVYHRDGRACLRCRRTVVVADLVGRRVYWCPGCQRAS